MATFGPYVLNDVLGGLPVDAVGPARKMFRNKGAEPQGRNVWILSDGTAVDEQPQATYDSNGVLLLDGNQRTVRFMQGPMTYTITAAESTILTSSGFGAYVH